MTKLWVGRALAGVLLATTALAGFTVGHGTSGADADSQWGATPLSVATR